MVNADRADNAAGRINRVHGIKPAAQTDLKNHGIRFCLHEQQEYREPRHLEVRERHVASCGIDRGKRLNKRRVFGFFAVNQRALVKAQQVRRRVHANFVAGVTQNAFEHRAGAALAVCARNGKDRTGEGNAQPLNHGLHACEPHVNGLFV